MTFKGRNRSESEKGINLSGNKCIVCGWNKCRKNGKTLLEGAHVRPHESGPEFDKADNIIALCPNHHTEYDAYNFCIDAKTKCLIFIDESDAFNNKDVSNEIKHVKQEYLAYEQYLFNKNNQ